MNRLRSPGFSLLTVCFDTRFWPEFRTSWARRRRRSGRPPTDISGIGTSSPNRRVAREWKRFFFASVSCSWPRPPLSPPPGRPQCWNSARSRRFHTPLVPRSPHHLLSLKGRILFNYAAPKLSERDQSRNGRGDYSLRGRGEFVKISLKHLCIFSRKVSPRTQSGWFVKNERKLLKNA